MENSNKPALPAYFKPLRPSYNRRAAWHDYRSRSIYMVTVTAQRDAPLFGRLLDDGKSPAIALSELGFIVEEEILATRLHHPAVSVLSHIVMPDHFHALMFVRERINCHFGRIVNGLKGAITRRARLVAANPSLNLFKEGFHDRILAEAGQLETLRRYIADNPRRLAIKRRHPDLFRRYNHLRIGNREFAAYGNIFLLRNFDKRAVIVHRRYSLDERQRLERQWTRCAENGGALVSPFISPAEKQIRDKALDAGGGLIILRAEGFREKFKPTGSEFELCESGRLLLLAPWPNETRGSSMTRAQALSLNHMAEEIAGIRLEPISLAQSQE